MQARAKATVGWDPESTAAFWINRTSRALLRSFDARLQPFGFAMSHLPVLRALGDGRALSQRQLVDLARVEQSTMAQMLARMERDEVILREPDPNDNRATLVSLTRRARSLVPKAMAALIEAEKNALRGLTDAEKTILRDLLQRVIRNLE